MLIFICESRGSKMRNILRFLSKRLLFFMNDLLDIKNENIIHVRQSMDLIFIQNDASYYSTSNIMLFLKEFDLQVMNRST